jgi:hypothetical protein
MVFDKIKPPITLDWLEGGGLESRERKTFVLTASTYCLDGIA